MLIRLRYDGWIDEVINSAGVVGRGPAAWTLIGRCVSLELDARAAAALGFPRDCRLHLVDMDDNAVRQVRATLLEILQCACQPVRGPRRRIRTGRAAAATLLARSRVLMDHVVVADIVEIHVPLVPDEDLAPGAYGYPWIDQIEEFLGQLEETGTVEVYDDGEEDGAVYIFFITGASEADLLVAASRVATLDGVPPGAFAVVTDDQAPTFGMGRRVNLPVPSS